MEVVFFIVKKGFVVFDGIFLMVNEVDGLLFLVFLILYMFEVINWFEWCEGDKINLEVDMMV